MASYSLILVALRTRTMIDLSNTGNFSTASFTNWLDEKSCDALEFFPPGFHAGKFTLHFEGGRANI